MTAAVCLSMTAAELPATPKQVRGVAAAKDNSQVSAPDRLSACATHLQAPVRVTAAALAPLQVRVQVRVKSICVLYIGREARTKIYMRTVVIISFDTPGTNDTHL